MESILANLFMILFLLDLPLFWAVLFEDGLHRRGEERPVLKTLIILIIVEIILFIVAHDSIIHLS